MWLSEGGQSAAGAAIDRLVAFHPAAADAGIKAQALNVPLPVYLADLALAKLTDPSSAIEMAKGLHVVPEYSGNRAPFADPHARAAMAGLGMERSLDNLIALYIAGLCGIGYGLRQIIDAQRDKGVKTDKIVISGGAGQHPLVRQLLADACDLPMLTTRCSEPVLLGSAMLGAVAGNVTSTVSEAMAVMTKLDRQFEPHQAYRQTHLARYESYKLLQRTVKTVRNC